MTDIAPQDTPANADPVDPATLAAVPPAALVYFGRMKGEWPLHSFEDEATFAAWLADDEHRVKCGWKASVADVQRLGLAVPAAPSLEVVADPTDEAASP